MEHSGFIEQSAIELREVFISYGLGSGVDREIMEPLVTDAHIAEAAEGLILQKYGRSSGYSFEQYSNEIYVALSNYVLSMGLQITEDVQTGLRDLADLSVDAVRNHLDSVVIQVLAQTQRYTRIMYIAVAIVSVLTIATIIIIPSVNRRVTRWIDGYIYALGAASLLCIVIPILYFQTGISTRLQVEPLSYFMLITSWLDGIFSGFLSALIPLVVLIIICVIIRVQRRKKREKRKRYLEYNSYDGYNTGGI